MLRNATITKHHEAWSIYFGYLCQLEFQYFKLHCIIDVKKKDTTVIEEYPIEAPIVSYLGMSEIERIKIERNATEEETRSILPEVNM